MTKIDLKKELRHLYGPSAKEAEIVDVPEMDFLMIDGWGDPNTVSEFRERAEALYAVSYALKFMVKKANQAIDYSVMPLEGLWWMEDMSQFSLETRDSWEWTLMMMQPEYVTSSLVDEALAQVERKKFLPDLARIRFETFHEGLSAQVLHVGPYAAEGPTIEKLHAFINESRFQLAGKHHEIYLSDPRRAAPEKLKTILRQPIAK